MNAPFIGNVVLLVVRMVKIQFCVSVLERKPFVIPDGETRSKQASKLRDITWNKLPVLAQIVNGVADSSFKTMFNAVPSMWVAIPVLGPTVGSAINETVQRYMPSRLFAFSAWSSGSFSPAADEDEDMTRQQPATDWDLIWRVWAASGKSEGQAVLYNMAGHHAWSVAFLRQLVTLISEGGGCEEPPPQPKGIEPATIVDLSNMTKVDPVLDAEESSDGSWFGSLSGNKKRKLN